MTGVCVTIDGLTKGATPNHVLTLFQEKESIKSIKIINPSAANIFFKNKQDADKAIAEFKHSGMKLRYPEPVTPPKEQGTLAFIFWHPLLSLQYLLKTIWFALTHSSQLFWYGMTCLVDENAANFIWLQMMTAHQDENCKAGVKKLDKILHESYGRLATIQKDYDKSCYELGLAYNRIQGDLNQKSRLQGKPPRPVDAITFRNSLETAELTLFSSTRMDKIDIDALKNNIFWIEQNKNKIEEHRRKLVNASNLHQLNEYLKDSYNNVFDGRGQEDMYNFSRTIQEQMSEIVDFFHKTEKQIGDLETVEFSLEVMNKEVEPNLFVDQVLQDIIPLTLTQAQLN